MFTDQQEIDLPSKQTANAPFNSSLAKFLGDLDWRSIHALFDHQDFNPSLRWIAGQVGCTVEKVAEAIEGMITLGVVKRTSEGYEVVQKDILFSEPDQVSRETRIDSNIMLAKQIADKRDYVATGFDRVAILSSNKSLIDELHHKIADALKDFRQKSLENKKDGVYCISVIATDIIPEEES